MSSIEVRDVRIGVGDLRLEVDALDVPEGSRLVLYGPNGAGKTTLLRHLFATTESAYLPQRPWAFRGSAVRSLRLGLRGAARTVAEGLAADLGVAGALDRPGRSLSGGERQRISLARVLARPERIVLLDEPLNAIDAADVAAVVAVLDASLHGRTAVIITHDRDRAASLGETVAVMIGGRIRQHGAIEEVFSLPVDETVAGVVGVGNVLPGRVAESGAGLCALAYGEAIVWGLGDLADGARAVALFGGEAVTVHAGRHGSPGSARNSWAGRVQRVEQMGRLVEVVVDVGAPLVALLTPGSIEALDIRPGSHVTLTVKAASVRIVPR